MHTGGTLIGEKDQIAGVPLCASDLPQSGLLQPIVRITITCRDVLGLKHASIFDYTRHGSWIAIATLKEILCDIDDIDAQNQRIGRPAETTGPGAKQSGEATPVS